MGMIDTMALEFLGGSDFDDCLKVALTTSKQLNCNVKFKFNGVLMIVDKDMPFEQG